jgi:hypothetical protein
MKHKTLSLIYYRDFPVSWEVLKDGTTILNTELFQMKVNHVVDNDNISQIVAQLMVELYSDVITIH